MAQNGAANRILSRPAGGRLQARKRSRGRILIRQLLARLKAFDTIDAFLLSGLLLLPFQVVQVSILQPGHLWMLGALAFLVLKKEIKVGSAEVVAYLLFLSAASVLTLLQDFPRIKSAEQLLKFALVYPGFYLVGRWLGIRFLKRDLPVGYLFLCGLLAFEFMVQMLGIPIIFKEIDFGQGALHGTFKERNWLSFYFFLVSYFLLLKSSGEMRFLPFFVLNGVVTVLSSNKTALVACGAVYILQSKVSVFIKLAAIAIGAMFYITVLGDEFTQDKIAVKLEEERGLAFQVSAELIDKNPLGYGFGFVEAFFSTNSLSVRGLGEGTNSVFAVPLDLAIVAGLFGVIMWLVFYCGLGLGLNVMIGLAPIALLSLLNPLHQSEIFYFFIGALVSNRMRQSLPRVREKKVLPRFGRSRAWSMQTATSTPQLRDP